MEWIELRKLEPYTIISDWEVNSIINNLMYLKDELESMGINIPCWEEIEKVKSGEVETTDLFNRIIDNLICLKEIIEKLYHKTEWNLMVTEIATPGIEVGKGEEVNPNTFETKTGAVYTTYEITIG